MDENQLELTERLIESIEEKTGLDILEVSASTSRISRGSKIDRAAARIAMQIAKSRKDPLYLKYRKYNLLRKDIKKQIMKKYSNRGRVQARKVMA